MPRTKHPVASARERIVSTAGRLFYAEGVRAVGVDRVIAEAGVAKATLYAHFPSKDDLIVAVLRRRDETFTAAFEQSVARHARRTGDRLRGFFAALKEWFESDDFRGCAFINATAELADPAHPGMAEVRGHKARFHEQLAAVVAEAVGKPARKTAAAVALLVEGAIVMAQMTGDPSAADAARDAAAALIASARRG
jgi:AcrR family transcriptional regulator